MMGLSICIATYNRLPHLKRLMDSIKNGFDDYPYEIIVADGGSTDGTIDYLKGSKNVTLIEQGKLIGAVKSFNACFKLAKYDYVMWPADDFILFPNIIIKACNLMDQHKDLGLVGPKTLEPCFGNLPDAELYFSYLVLTKTHIFRKSVLKEMDYLDEKYKIYGIDDDSCLAVLDRGYTIAFTKEVGIIHNRIRDELRANNKEDLLRDGNYLKEKWAVLNSRIANHIKLSFLKSMRLKFFRFFSRGIFRLGEIGYFRFMPGKGLLLIGKLYDVFLMECLYFKASEYQQVDELYLAQRLPEKITKSNS